MCVQDNTFPLNGIANISLICSWFLVSESPSVWINVSHCFLLCAHVHLTQGKLAVIKRWIVYFVR